MLNYNMLKGDHLKIAAVFRFTGPPAIQKSLSVLTDAASSGWTRPQSLVSMTQQTRLTLREPGRLIKMLLLGAQGSSGRGKTGSFSYYLLSKSSARSRHQRYISNIKRTQHIYI